MNLTGSDDKALNLGFNIHKKQIFFAAIALLVTFACWAMSNPIGSTHDEWFHAGSIWCAEGVNQSSCIETRDPVDNGYYMGVAPIEDGSCFLNDTAEISNCKKPILKSYPINHKLYPSSYYRIMHTFITVHPTLSILSMRLFNSSIATLLLVAQLLLTTNRQRIATLTGFVFTLIPMTIFFVSSIHPSGWAISGVTNSWIFLLIALTNKNHNHVVRRWAWFFWITSMLMVFLSRYDAFIFLLASNFVVVITTRFPNKRPGWKFSLLAATTVSLSLLFLSKINGLVSWIFQFPLDRPDGTTETSTWISHWVIQTIAVPISALGTEILGQGLPGQLTVRIPDVVWIIGTALLGAAILFSFIKTSATQLVVFCGSYVVLLFTILSFNGRVMERDLFNMSGRYVLPVIPFIVGFCIFASKSPFQLMEIRRLRIIVIALLTMIHFLALHAVVETFVDGQTHSVEPIHVGSAGWWWSGMPIGPNFVVLLGSIAFFWFLTFAWSTVATVQVGVVSTNKADS